MAFINDDFMLHSKTAKHLFMDYAKDMPVIDYHCHLSPRQIAENYQFRNAFDVFLSGDHYKWRQMRSNGIEEKYITGDAGDWMKFQKWAETVPYLIGNPLYHWTHLELKRYFGIDQGLSPETAEEIWEKCNVLLNQDEFRAKALIEKANVEVICTTDDPMDDLAWHQQIKKDGFGTKVLPTFRPDKLVEIEKEGFLEYLQTAEVDSYDSLLKKLSERILFFHKNGCRLADHGIAWVPFVIGDAAAVLDKKLNGGQLTAEEADIYRTGVILHCGREYAKLGWTMQLHMGAIRNNNTKMFRALGPDAGFDSIGDYPVAQNVSRLLDTMETENLLPRTILYSLNPNDNYVLAAMLGNFQGGGIPGKIQLGSGWWFNDQRDGMEEQMRALANLGLLSRFVGMLTDSRSFVSYPRHEYFRRIMCNLIGGWVETGEYPNDEKMLEKIVRGISYQNAKEYFQFT